MDPETSSGSLSDMPLMITISEIRIEYLKKTAIWVSGRPNLTVNNVPSSDMCEHIEISEDEQFSLVYMERAFEFGRRKTKSLDQLFYWMAVDEAEYYAMFYEYENQQPKIDTRRITFPTSEARLLLVSERWAEQLKSEHEQQLLQSPFQDFPSPYCRYRGKALISQISYSYSLAGTK